jgi:acetyltransferase-like isoleucine patch superfamily enzyme
MNTDARGLLFKIAYRVRHLLSLYCLNYLVRIKLFLHGVETGKHPEFFGAPRINRAPGSRIVFGDSCIFRSSRSSVAIGLYRPCSFVTFRSGARIEVGNYSGGTGVTIAAAGRISIGRNVILGAYTTIIDNDFHNTDPSLREAPEVKASPVEIGDNVFIGFNCMILKGVTIGANAVIGANSVVVTSIPPDSVAMGNPCKVIMRRKW